MQLFSRPSDKCVETNSPLGCESSSFCNALSSFQRKLESIYQDRNYCNMDISLRWYDKSQILTKNDKPNSGFTLVELSIVLMVIGLLVSGILVGQDMIRGAELRSIVTDKDRIQTSIMLFKQKYDALPGDMPNATAFWGLMPTGTCSQTSVGASGGTGTQTCNGNGDGLIEADIIVFVAGANLELLLAWQHLSNAGLIQGQYNGIFSGAWGASGQGPPSNISNSSIWQISNLGSRAISDIDYFEGTHINELRILSPGITAAERDAQLTPSEAWNIDKKIDDGLPGLGNMVTYERNGAPCNTLDASSTVAIAGTATYNVTNPNKTCRPNFRYLF